MSEQEEELEWANSHDGIIFSCFMFCIWKWLAAIWGKAKFMLKFKVQSLQNNKP